MSTEKTAIIRTMTGRVVSTKMQKTIVVEVERKVKHRAYGKYVRRFTRLYAHDPLGQSAEGDVVTVRMCRPVSRKKQWVLESVQSRSGQKQVEAGAAA